MRDVSTHTSDQPAREEPKRAGQPEAAEPRPSLRLGWLVTIGIVVTLLLGVLFFCLFVWTQTALGSDRFFTAAADVNGDVLFNAARTALTMVTVIGLGGAALLAYRRQRSTEDSQATASKALEVSAKSQMTAALAQQTAAGALVLSQEQFRHTTERALRERYTEAAELLGSPQFPMRMAGVYALAALADDWHGFGDDTERQVCIDLLCAYLRTDTAARYGGEDTTDTEKRAKREEENTVRASIIATIRAHRLKSRTKEDPRNWRTCALDLTGAKLMRADFSDADLRGTDLIDADLTDANLYRTNLAWVFLSDTKLAKTLLHGTDLTHGHLNGADFTDASIRETKFTDAQLVEAKFIGAEIRDTDFTDTNLTIADFTAAEVGTANFTRADLTKAVLSDIDLTESTLDRTITQGAKYSAQTRWSGGTPPDGAILM
ncbi:pentapeptide repeat-containing protein [Rhodococcus sp. WS4]|nr:pentapeptide repeat-containing protein [Rhodococcus sp. WS4]